MKTAEEFLIERNFNKINGFPFKQVCVNMQKYAEYYHQHKLNEINNP